MDYGEMIKFGFSGYREREIWKYVIAYIIVLVAYSLLNGMLFGLNGVPVKGIGFGGVATWFALLIALMIAVMPIQIKLATLPMRSLGLKVHKDMLSPISLEWTGHSVRMIMQHVIASVYAAICWYNKKFALAIIACVVFFAATIWFGINIHEFWLGVASFSLFLVSIALLIISGLAYFCVLMYNSLRLVFRNYVFIEDPHASLRGMVRKAWDGTEGKVIEILVANIIVFVIMIIPVVVALIPYFALLFVNRVAGRGFIQIVSALFSVFSIYCVTFMYSRIVVGGKKETGAKAKGKGKR